jgi:hypothetical protein
MVDDSQEYKALQKILESKYFVPFMDAKLFEDFEAILKSISDRDYVALGQAFQSNIHGLVTTLSFPFYMASSRVVDEQYDHILEKLNLSPDALSTTNPSREEAIRKVSDAIKQAVLTDEGKFAFLKRTVSVLDDAYDKKQAAAIELLLQGAVLCWSALEVFCRDFFVVYMNKRPGMFSSLNKDDTTKKRFELTTKALIEHLEGNDYNLSSRMGTILAHRQDFSDFATIQTTFRVLFKDQSPFDSDIKGNLSFLAARRHLIVHRRGVIDETYRRCDESTAIGDRLNLTPEDIKVHVATTVTVVTAVLNLIQTQ